MGCLLLSPPPQKKKEGVGFSYSLTVHSFKATKHLPQKNDVRPRHGLPKAPLQPPACCSPRPPTGSSRCPGSGMPGETSTACLRRETAVSEMPAVGSQDLFVSAFKTKGVVLVQKLWQHVAPLKKLGSSSAFAMLALEQGTTGIWLDCLALFPRTSRSPQNPPDEFEVVTPLRRESLRFQRDLLKRRKNGAKPGRQFQTSTPQNGQANIQGEVNQKISLHCPPPSEPQAA